jgi:capsular polysaccharide transport system permease protein
MPQQTAPATRPPAAARRSFRSLRAIAALMLREMATRYGRSPGGYVWALLEPLGAIAILAIGFSLIIRSPSLGNSFLLFYATGFMPFILYQDLSNHVARSVNFSRALLYYPVVTWVDALAARFVLNTLTGILVAAIVLGLVSLFTETRMTLDLVPILRAMALAILLGGGIGVLNCALFGLFPVWMQVWSIATRPLFLVSGVFFLYEDMPATAQSILWWNPLIHIIGIMREGFYVSYQASYASVLFVALTGLLALFFGVVLMGRYHRDILQNG